METKTMAVTTVEPAVDPAFLELMRLHRRGDFLLQQGRMMGLPITSLKGDPFVVVPASCRVESLAKLVRDAILETVKVVSAKTGIIPLLGQP